VDGLDLAVEKILEVEEYMGIRVTNQYAITNSPTHCL